MAETVVALNLNSPKDVAIRNLDLVLRSYGTPCSACRTLPARSRRRTNIRRRLVAAMCWNPSSLLLVPGSTRGCRSRRRRLRRPLTVPVVSFPGLESPPPTGCQPP